MALAAIRDLFSDGMKLVFCLIFFICGPDVPNVVVCAVWTPFSDILIFILVRAVHVGSAIPTLQGGCIALVAFFCDL